MDTITKTSVAEQIISGMARAKHSAFIVGCAPMPLGPFQMGFHWVTPITEAPKGHERWYNFVKERQYPIQGFILIEDPRVTQAQESKVMPSIPNEVGGENIATIAAGVLTTVAVALFSSLLYVMLHDPYLCVVCEGGDWILIDSWYE